VHVEEALPGREREILGRADVHVDQAGVVDDAVETSGPPDTRGDRARDLALARHVAALEAHVLARRVAAAGIDVEDAGAAAVGDHAIDDRASYSPRAAGDENALPHVERWRIAW